MNEYDDIYEIRLARADERDKIMNFIHVYWKEGHILSRDKRLFEYEFLEGDKLHIIIAIRKTTGEIEGMLGYLPCSNGLDKEKFDIWGSIWKVRDDHSNMTFLGVELVKRLKEILQYRCNIGIGINPDTTLPIRKAIFKEKTGRMKHFYMLNKNIKKFCIACINQKPEVEDSITEGINTKEIENVIEFSTAEELETHFEVEKLNTIPYKDNWYINKRFFSHPYYQYMVYGIKTTEQKIGALVVMRSVEYQGSRILRIVDFLGDTSLFSGLGSNLKQIMETGGYEYIDFYSFGIDERYILNAGFTEKTDKDINVIPNYFEPFLQENVNIWIRYQQEGTVFCKADGDQDRPNIFREEPILEK